MFPGHDEQSLCMTFELIHCWLLVVGYWAFIGWIWEVDAI